MKYLLNCLLGIFFLCQHLNAANLTFVGTARHYKTNEVLYKETYAIEQTANGEYLSGTVVYQTPDGEVFANKKVDYQDNPLKPSFNFTDFRDNTQIQVKRRANQTDVRIESSDLNTDKTLTIDTNEINVIDAGFDPMVAQYWSQLIEGSILEFNFLALPKSSFVPLRIKPTEQTNTHLLLSIQAQNWFIRMLLSPIKLKYDKSTRRLVRYEGITNIRINKNGDIQDENYRAIIEYEYQ